MPKVTNTAKSDRGLTIFNREGGDKKPTLNASDIETVTIKPGETAEVDEAFLATEGAKALIECGDLEVEGGEKAKAKKPAKGSGGGDQTGEGKSESGSE